MGQRARSAKKSPKFGVVATTRLNYSSTICPFGDAVNVADRMAKQIDVSRPWMSRVVTKLKMSGYVETKTYFPRGETTISAFSLVNPPWAKYTVPPFVTTPLRAPSCVGTCATTVR